MSPAGYSGTPLPKKLGIKEGSRVHLAGAPTGFDATLGALPEGAREVGATARDPDVTLVFAKTRARLEAAFRKRAERMTTDGCLWGAWPKKSSGVATDLGFDVVQRLGLDSGLVDTKICAVDETWSGLKFMIRVKDRPGRAPARKP
jgi:hypothetical protein